MGLFFKRRSVTRNWLHLLNSMRNISGGYTTWTGSAFPSSILSSLRQAYQQMWQPKTRLLIFTRCKFISKDISKQESSSFKKPKTIDRFALLPTRPKTSTKPAYTAAHPARLSLRANSSSCPTLQPTLAQNTGVNELHGRPSCFYNSPHLHQSSTNIRITWEINVSHKSLLTSSIWYYAKFCDCDW